MISSSSSKCLLVVACLVLLAGCSDGRPELVPVSGTVLLDGKPLSFGSVMFQPDTGPPARGDIGPDGRFELSTFEEGDGAAIGRNRVRITCFENQNSMPEDPNVEIPTGRLLIPEKYTSIDRSGIVIEVESGGELDPIELSSRG